VLFFLVIPLVAVIFPVIKRQFPNSMQGSVAQQKN